MRQPIQSSPLRSFRVHSVGRYAAEFCDGHFYRVGQEGQLEIYREGANIAWIVLSIAAGQWLRVESDMPSQDELDKMTQTAEALRIRQLEEAAAYVAAAQGTTNGQMMRGN